MLTSSGHLSYCTNIHSGKNWTEDFEILRQYFPEIKQAVSPEKPMGLGLRLSHEASLELQDPSRLSAFKTWLQQENAYVFTLNGFPYGEFHHAVLKADVHCPDWTTAARRDYTIRLFKILAELLPHGQEGGISTSPLSYRHWFKTPEDLKQAREEATLELIAVLKTLILLSEESGQDLHLDIEPEPDGILETGQEYIDWFEQDLLRLAIPALISEFAFSAAEAEASIKKHICLCYDVCHFAIGYEEHAVVIANLKQKGLRVGKIQISAALKADLQLEASLRQDLKDQLSQFNEPTYLHQVVARQANGGLLRYSDLPEALADFDHPDITEWRAHFHVPLALQNIGLLQTTQSDISTLLALQHDQHFTNHLEVETYTWEVLPQDIKLPLSQSITNELQWVLKQIDPA